MQYKRHVYVSFHYEFQYNPHFIILIIRFMYPVISIVDGDNPSLSDYVNPWPAVHLDQVIVSRKCQTTVPF